MCAYIHLQFALFPGQIDRFERNGRGFAMGASTPLLTPTRIGSRQQLTSTLASMCAVATAAVPRFFHSQPSPRHRDREPPPSRRPARRENPDTSPPPPSCRPRRASRSKARRALLEPPPRIEAARSDRVWWCPGPGGAARPMRRGREAGCDAGEEGEWWRR